MAERRMFAKTIVDSDAFLDMPISSQCLYFHLAMRADDEGFVNKAKSIIRTVGAKEEDFRPLIERRFVIVFDDGVLVIKHWRIHNWIRGDRLQPTKYQQHKNTLSLDENNAYSDQPTGICQTSDCQLSDKCHTEVRLGKVSIGKEDTSSQSDFDLFWRAYPKKIGKAAAKKSFAKVKVNINTLISAVEQQKLSDQWRKDNGQYIPNPTTWLNQGRWDDELSGIDKPVEQAKPKKYREVVINGETILEVIADAE